MTLIQVNDNPTRWFLADHPIRQADRYFNEAFAGSYPAYWVLEKKRGGWHQPESLKKLEKLLNEIESMPEVGKVTGLPALVNKIHRELRQGKVNSRFPSSARAVKQYLFLYENSGNPQDLFRIVNNKGSEVNVWFSLKSGDNRVMARVKRKAEQLLNNSDIKLKKQPRWGGVTVVNLTWQNVMVRGMAWALAGSFVVIFFMMLFLFRSIRWALLSLVPLTTTLVLVYGLVGWFGKDYDMPVAVLSALSIGIAVDFAIHYIQRTRQIMHKHGPWPEIRERVSGEPSRAIARNAVVIAVGFSPLLLAPLRPYVTVGVFMILIMVIAGTTTLIGLFSLFEVLHPLLPDETE
ncbi:MAG: MMPL family transporter [bacterium]